MLARRMALCCFLSVLVSLAFGIASPRAQTAKTIKLGAGFSETLKLNRPAKAISIGDPKIADATVGAGNTIVLTGKAPGTTNLIALDQDGAEVFRATIQVSSAYQVSVRIYNGTSAGETQLCSVSSCIPSPEITVRSPGRNGNSGQAGTEPRVNQP